jgi:hypothetical protein
MAANPPDIAGPGADFPNVKIELHAVPDFWTNRLTSSKCDQNAKTKVFPFVFIFAGRLIETTVTFSLN